MIGSSEILQQRVEKNSRTHHSKMNFDDRIQEEGMEQMATVAAAFADHAATLTEPLPRK